MPLIAVFNREYKNNMDNVKKFDYEIIKTFVTLSRSGRVSKQLNLVSYDGNRPKYDLRNWKTEADGTKKPLKGLTLTDEETEVLRLFFLAEANEGQTTEDLEDEDELILSDKDLENLY